LPVGVRTGPGALQQVDQVFEFALATGEAVGVPSDNDVDVAGGHEIPQRLEPGRRLPLYALRSSSMNSATTSKSSRSHSARRSADWRLTPSSVPCASLEIRQQMAVLMNERLDNNTEWYWDLTNKVAVPARERGPAMRVLGPYPSKAAAENWRDTVEQRNEVWDADDAKWEGETRDDG
jgi:hypothetical protein